MNVTKLTDNIYFKVPKRTERIVNLTWMMDQGQRLMEIVDVEPEVAVRVDAVRVDAVPADVV
jgi:hypothetical protein